MSSEVRITINEDALAESARGKLEDLASDIEKDMRRLVPIDTGDLRSTCKAEVNADGTGIDISAGGEADSGEYVDYAEHVEYGTRYMPAQPYVRPAVQKNRGRL